MSNLDAFLNQVGTALPDREVCVYCGARYVRDEDSDLPLGIEAGRIKCDVRVFDRDNYARYAGCGRIILPADRWHVTDYIIGHDDAVHTVEFSF